MIDLPERIVSKFTIDAETGCWRWRASKVDGYGNVWWDKRVRYAHVVIYTLLVGSIPDGMQLDHLCHNDGVCAGGPACPHRSCVNPGHLNLTTLRGNIFAPGSRSLAATHAAATHCPQGHPYEGENLIFERAGGRRCRICRDAKNRARRVA